MDGNDSTTHPGAPLAAPADRLDSWKDIAAYLKRDVRTVRRWEEKEHLPVHRHLHSKRGSVYASKSELDAWWNQGRRRLDAQSPDAARDRSSWPRFMLIASLALLALAAGWYFARRRSASTAPGTVRLVVLPFANFSGDPEQEYLSDGITEEIITQLGRLQPQGLALIARTSVMPYKQAPKGVGEVGRELKADYLLEGSVRTGNGRIRITAQLIRVRDETHLWAEQYDRELRDILGLQSEISQAVTRQIQLKVSSSRSGPGARSVDPEAYQLYLRGRHLLNHRSGGRESARQSFQDAIARDAAFAGAYAGLADALVRIALFGPTPAAEAWRQAEAAARKALELDETLPEAHSAMAAIRLHRDWNFAEAERENLQAIALNPSAADAHASYANLLRAVARAEEAIQEKRRALELDPLRVDLVTGLGKEYVFARKYDEAIEQFRQALQLDGRYVPAVNGIADAYARKARYHEAAAEQVRLLNLRQETELAAQFERLCRTSGYAAAAKMLDQKALAAYLKRPAETNSWNVAFTYARLGDRENAFRWLEKAFALRDPGLLLIRVDPDVDNLRSDPRFEDLLRRMRSTP